MNTYSYTSTAGHNVVLTANIHNLIQRGVVVGHVNGGKLNKQCTFVVTDGAVKITLAAKVTAKVAKPVKAKTAKTVTVTLPKVKGAKSKAELVRERIALAKTNGDTIDAVISYGINELGQSKSQAKIYAENNWNKS